MSILVYVDHERGTAKQISWEIMGKARELADQAWRSRWWRWWWAIRSGSLAQEAICYGADQVLVAEGPEFAQFRALAYAAALKAAIEQAPAGDRPG